MAGTELGAEVLQQVRQRPERILDRLQPASELEERLARLIVVCDTKLEQIVQQFARAWHQLRTIDVDVSPQIPLSGDLHGRNDRRTV